MSVRGECVLKHLILEILCENGCVNTYNGCGTRCCLLLHSLLRG